jgi:hypothetical protein
MVNSQLPPRKFSRADFGRSAIALPLLAIAFAAWFFVLPCIQATILPSAPGGMAGPWVLRPIIAARFCATAFLAAITMPLFMVPLSKRWRAKDAELGSRYDPFRNRPFGKARIFLAGGALALIYAAALLAYVSCWDDIGPAGIVDRLPWVTKKHGFDQIASLETIPAGMHSDGVARDGPWYRINFTDGGNFTFGHENEGCSDDDISAIAKFIAERSKQAWQVRPDVKRNRRPWE